MFSFHATTGVISWVLLPACMSMNVLYLTFFTWLVSSSLIRLIITVHRLEMLSQIGRTPNFMLEPPKENLVEKASFAFFLFFGYLLFIIIGLQWIYTAKCQWAEWSFSVFAEKSWITQNVNGYILSLNNPHSYIILPYFSLESMASLWSYLFYYLNLSVLYLSLKIQLVD